MAAKQLKYKSIVIKERTKKRCSKGSKYYKSKKGCVSCKPGYTAVLELVCKKKSK